jgi:hypothetical protein
VFLTILIITIFPYTILNHYRLWQIQMYPFEIRTIYFIFIFSGSAAQRGLWPPCGSAAQCGLWPPVALQPSAGYGLLWLCSPARAMASSFTRLLDHTKRQSVGLLWTSDQLVAETSTWQHTAHTTDKHPCPGGIRTHDRSRRAAVDLRLRRRGHWDRREKDYNFINNT